MRTNKKLGITELISIVGVLLMTLILQYSEDKLNDYQNLIQKEFINKTKNLELINHYQNKKEDTYLSILLLNTGEGHFKIPEVADVKGPLSEEITDIIKKYEEGIISERDLLSEESRLYAKTEEAYISSYRIHLNYLENLIKNKPKLFFLSYAVVKKLAYIIQLFAILTLLFIYGYRLKKS